MIQAKLNLLNPSKQSKAASFAEWNNSKLNQSLVNASANLSVMQNDLSMQGSGLQMLSDRPRQLSKPRNQAEEQFQQCKPMIGGQLQSLKDQKLISQSMNNIQRMPSPSQLLKKQNHHKMHP